MNGWSTCGGRRRPLPADRPSQLSRRIPRIRTASASISRRLVRVSESSLDLIEEEQLGLRQQRGERIRQVVAQLVESVGFSRHDRCIQAVGEDRLAPADAQYKVRGFDGGAVNLNRQASTGTPAQGPNGTGMNVTTNTSTQSQPEQPPARAAPAVRGTSPTGGSSATRRPEGEQHPDQPGGPVLRQPDQPEQRGEAQRRLPPAEQSVGHMPAVELGQGQQVEPGDQGAGPARKGRETQVDRLRARKEAAPGRRRSGANRPARYWCPANSMKLAGSRSQPGSGVRGGVAPGQHHQHHDEARQRPGRPDVQQLAPVDHRGAQPEEGAQAPDRREGGRNRQEIRAATRRWRSAGPRSSAPARGPAEWPAAAAAKLQPLRMVRSRGWQEVEEEPRRRRERPADQAAPGGGMVDRRGPPRRPGRRRRSRRGAGDAAAQASRPAGPEGADQDQFGRDRGQAQ